MTELYLISGFLGAGKTTLLQKLLREGFAGQKVALVENDFGAVSLDAKLLKSGGYTVQELRAGCICCTLNGNFVSALVSLLRRVQPGVVLIKVPKTLALLEQQLRALRKVVTPDTRIIAGAKARDIHTSTLELFEKVLGPTTTTLAWKKARLINCTFNEPPLADAPQTVSWKLEGTDWTIHNHANVFSRTGLDIGARFFMQHLPENLEGEIVDLGCGNGVIGLTLLDKNPQAKVVFVDESPMAVASSRLNVETNMPEALDRCEFMINNALSGVEPFRFNAVLCNPPFHQQHALTDNVAWEMFHHARRCLKINGELYIVANRHLDYFHKLKKIFGNCTTIATNNKFVVLKAVKLGRRR